MDGSAAYVVCAHVRDCLIQLKRLKHLFVPTLETRCSDSPPKNICFVLKCDGFLCFQQAKHLVVSICETLCSDSPNNMCCAHTGDCFAIPTTNTFCARRSVTLCVLIPKTEKYCVEPQYDEA